MKLKLHITTILLLISFQFLAAQQKIINVLDNTTKQPISNVIYICLILKKEQLLMKRVRQK